MNRETIHQLLQEYITNHGLSTDGPTVLWVKEDGQNYTLDITVGPSEIEVTVQETGIRYQYDTQSFA